MMNQGLRRVLLAGSIVIGVWCLSIAGIILRVQTAHLDRIMTDVASTTEKAPVAIVLGASVKPDGEPSDALKDRLIVGEALYQNGNVDKILLTGDDGGMRSDEISVMKAFLKEDGIPDEDVLVDGHGYRTFESCRRANEEFNIDRAIIVTQRFHMGRALYLCNALGIDSVGMTSDLEPYVKGTFFWLRDLAASVKAWWEIRTY
jgi:vancomycin permeability regulator SanA